MGEDNNPDTPIVDKPLVVPPVPAGPTVEDLQRQLDEQKRSNDSLMALLEKHTAPVPTSTPAPYVPTLTTDFAAKYSIPNEAVQEIVGEVTRLGQGLVEKTVNDRISQYQAAQEIRAQFYRDNPDLNDHQALVQAIANDLQVKSPQMKVIEALAETAKRARKYVKDIQDKTRNGEPPPPPPVLPGGGNRDGGGGGGGGNGPDVPLTPEEELRQDVAARREARNKALGVTTPK